MTETRKISARRAKVTAVLFAGLTAGAIAGPGLVQAQEYPPQPPVTSETTTTTTISLVVSGPGTPEAPVTDQAGALPSTGNSDVAPSLMIAGTALLAGLAITGAAAASRRRDHTDPGATLS